MSVETFTGTLIEAVKFVENKGMKFAFQSPFSDLNRGYFAYGDGKDVFLDHTATVTEIEHGLWAVSDFSYLRKE